jgi:hypothetical protein
MGGQRFSWVRGSRRTAASLLLVLTLMLLPLAPSSSFGAPSAPAQDASAQTLEPDVCLGDEAITFAPPQPEVDQELLVAVSSSFPHRGVWLASSERPTFLREYEGQQGWVWNWLVMPTSPGLLRVRFFVDSTIFCAEATVLVGPSTHPQPTATPTPTPLTTSQPTIVVRSRRSSEDNSNDDESADDVPAPEITSIEPTVSCPGGNLTIQGRGFGDSRQEVDGQVLISDREVSSYLSWSNREVEVLVPNGAGTGSARKVYLITIGGYDQSTVNLVTNC